MATLTVIGIATFLVLLWSMAMTAGTQDSISQLAKQWRWLLLVALWSQVLLLPQMFAITPSNWQWLAAIGMFSIVICGGANVLDKTDEWVHMIAAGVAFVCMFGWVLCINPRCLLPLVVCAMAGRSKWQWRLEIGLIISVYLTLILDMYAK